LYLILYVADNCLIKTHVADNCLIKTHVADNCLIKTHVADNCLIKSIYYVASNHCSTNQFMRGTNIPFRSPCLGYCFLAARHRRLDILRWLREKRFKWEEFLQEDVTDQQFKQYTLARGFTWNGHEPIASLEEILNFIRDSEYEPVIVDGVYTIERIHCPWAEDDLTFYICMGDFKMVKTLIIDKKHYICLEHYSYASFFGYLHMIECILEHDTNIRKEASCTVKNICYLHTKKFIGKSILKCEEKHLEWIRGVDQCCDELTYNDLANLIKSYV